jgi:photosystem II stability/assembly factor-like uncharacterized protein
MVEQCIAPGEIQEGDLVAYIEGVASGRVARHIAGCPACAAEVKALRVTDALFSSALRQVNGPIVSEFCSDQIARSRPIPPKTKRSFFGRNWLSWPEMGSRRHLLQPIAMAFLLLLVLLGLPVGIVYVINASLPDYSSDVVSNGVTTVVVTVEETAEIIRKVATKVTMADVDEDAEVVGTLTPSRIIVEKTVEIVPPRSLRLNLERSNNVIVVEKMVEIVPPRSLRQMIEREFHGKTDSLSVYSSTATNSDGSEHLVTGTDGKAYAVLTDKQYGETAIYFVRSTDGGQTWSDKVQINEGIKKVFNPSLAVDVDKNLYVVWRSGYNINATLYFARSTDSGQTWSKITRVEDTVGQTFKPSLTVGAEGDLYVTWQNRYRAKISIYSIESTDGGETWSDKVRVANIGS